MNPLKSGIFKASKVRYSNNNNNNNSFICQSNSEFENHREEDNSMASTLDRMKVLGVKQVDMIRKLRERGIAIQPPELSSMLHGVNTYPKSKTVLNECDAILSDLERSH